MALKYVGKNSKFAKFETIDGCEGMCLSLNDTRISGPKPWGGGRAITECYPNKERLLKLIEGKDTVNIYVVDYGCKGFWINGVNLSRRGTKDDYRKHLEKMEKLLKRKSLKAYHEYRECCFWNVKTADIKESINDSFYMECK